MKKTSIILALILILAMTLTSCGNKITSDTLATIDDVEVVHSDFDVLWEAVCQDYGITDDIEANETYAVEINELKVQVLDSLVYDEVLKLYIENSEYVNLSEEELELAATNTNDILEYYAESAHNGIVEELGADYTEEAYQEKLDAYITETITSIGMTREEFDQYFITEVSIQKIQDEIYSTVEVSEADLQAKYTELVEYDKSQVGDDGAMYTYYTQYGYDLLYVPEGVRLVKHILVGIDATTQATISALREAADTESADAARATGLEAIEDKANDILKDLQNGVISFEEGISLYNEDPGMTSISEGYMVAEGDYSLVAEFVEASMALENINDLSGLVGTDYGYHIIIYSSDVVAGAVPYEDVIDKVTEEATSTANDAAWAEFLEEIAMDYEIVKYPEHL